MKIHYQGIKSFCDSAPAGIGSLQTDEKWMSSHCRRAGRPSAVERIESRCSGGHERYENMREIRNPAVESCWELGDKPMRFIAFYIDKLYGIDIVNKINSMLCQEGVA
jgi:hypothetical protein